MDLLENMSDAVAATIGLASNQTLAESCYFRSDRESGQIPSPKSRRASRDIKITPKKRTRPRSSVEGFDNVSRSPVLRESVPTKGYSFDDLSSDSPLSDPPSDLDLASDSEGLVPSNLNTPVKSIQVKTVKAKRPTRSPYFPKPLPPKRITCLPFPPLSVTRFGLMQERLAHDPFHMLIATMFLNRTRGEQAIPVYFQVMERYPTIESMANAEPDDIMPMIHCLGFQNVRARKCVDLAKAWLSNPPAHGRRYRKINYPLKGDGRDVKADDVVTDEDGRVAWEIANLPGLGAYALDSWRIFCRDQLRGLASSFDVDGDESFEPEWKRVVPTDKELRAYLTWRWLKLGFIWNKETGEKTKADEKIMERAGLGGVVHEEGEYLVLTSELPTSTIKTGKVKSGSSTSLQTNSFEPVQASVERTAGSFMPPAGTGSVEGGEKAISEDDDSMTVQGGHERKTEEMPIRQIYDIEKE